MNILLPFAAVVLGVLIALIFKSKRGAFQLLLSFSGAFLLSITVFEFLPEVYKIETKLTGLFIMLGILLQIMLEFLSRGAEHGHMHTEDFKNHFPWSLFAGLCLHALLEGFPLEGNFHLLLGVAVHKIPIAAIVASILLFSGISKIKAIFFLGVFALMTPLGSLLESIFTFPPTVENNLNALVIGIFLHVSTTILFETSQGHHFNTTKMISIVLGMGLAFLL